MNITYIAFQSKSVTQHKLLPQSPQCRLLGAALELCLQHTLLVTRDKKPEIQQVS